MSYVDPYGSTRIVRGAAHLVGGKALAALAGVGTFLILVRLLPIEQYAAYTVLVGLVDLADAISAVGLAHVLSRYVPELNSQYRLGTLRRVVAGALALRALTLAMLLGAVAFLASSIAPWIGLGGWEWALVAYCGVAFVRVVAFSVFSVLESMLRQSVAQTGFALATVTRFVLLLSAAAQGEVDLSTVIFIEILSDAVGLGVMAMGLVRALHPRGGFERDDEPGWIAENRRRMVAFGLRGYLQHLLILPSGSATSRVAVGASLDGPSIALFGFAQSVTDLVNRYLPIRLFAGVIRPVMTARYVRDRRFDLLEQTANTVLKISAIPVCAVAVAVSAGGAELLSRVAGAQYAQATSLLLLFLALALTATLRQTLENLAHAVERFGPLIWSNTVISLSVLPGIALLPLLGVHALPAANLVGLVAATVLLIRRLRDDGFEYRPDLRGLSRIVGAAALGVGVGALLRWVDTGAMPAMAGALAMYGAALHALRPWSDAERHAAADLLRRARGRSS